MRKPAAKPPASGATRRCAIYTRKSSEEGLEQAFNSLDAQREACQAYILSQCHEGWVGLPTLYDDGGISGGTLERPALQQLLADIRAGKVDLVVVYKVDRLTRSLADFAKIVDVFDASGASFVSVTQQFNTTTSMGRLTLNMLLSFAQFEREVTGERIRDKIAASKCKGMWMGGAVPLGYDALDRKLVINEAEAETVRHIYRSYLTLGSVRKLQESLAAEGIRSKLRPSATAEKMRGGKPFERGALYLILQNRLYRGEIRHKDAAYPGQHEAIVDHATWEAVQQQLEQNRGELASGQRASMPSLLAGFLYDEQGERLIPTHAVKGKQRFRYYVSKQLNLGRSAPGTGLRIPAKELEQLVWEQIIQLLGDPPRLLTLLQPAIGDAHAQQQALLAAQQLTQSQSGNTVHERRLVLLRLLGTIVIRPDSLELRLDPIRLASALLGQQVASSAPPGDPIILTAPLVLKRIGYELRLVVEGAVAKPKPNAALIKLVVQAQRMRMQMLQEHLAVGELAGRNGLGGTYTTRLLRLSFLGPEIIAAILDGRQPLTFTANTLQRMDKLPLSWAEQRRIFGFG